MQHFRWFLAVGLIAAGMVVAVACDDDDDKNGAPAEVQLTDEDDGTSVSLGDGGTLIVVLVSNASTGYSWRVAGDLPDILSQEGDSVYVPPGSTSPVAGAAGNEKFTFKAAKTGEATLKLEYVRPFETGVPPEKTFEVTVKVE